MATSHGNGDGPAPSSATAVGAIARTDRHRRHRLPLPGRANDPEAFWRLLEAGVDAVTEVPADRWNVRALLRPGSRQAGQDVQPLGRLHRGDRPLRPALLRHLAAGSGPHGPAAAAAARSGLGGAGGRRPAPRADRRAAGRPSSSGSPASTTRSCRRASATAARSTSIPTPAAR